MTSQQFINTYNGRGVDVDGQCGNQCVDLFDRYLLDVIGVNWYPVVGAKNIWDNPNTPKYFDKIPNTPEGVPQLGDVVIWGMGTYGHVAIATGAGNTSWFNTLDQNWPWGLGYNTHPANINTHNYNNVIGWLRPKRGNNMDEQIRQIGIRLDNVGGSLNDIYVKITEDRAQIAAIGQRLDNVGNDLVAIKNTLAKIATSELAQDAEVQRAISQSLEAINKPTPQKDIVQLVIDWWNKITKK